MMFCSLRFVIGRLGLLGVIVGVNGGIVVVIYKGLFLNGRLDRFCLWIYGL